jgi:hypothetical protein
MRDHNLCEVLFVRMPPHLNQALKQEAARQDEPVAVVLRRLIRENLAAPAPSPREAVLERA